MQTKTGRGIRAALIGSTALVGAAGWGTASFAEAAAVDNTTLSEVVVTAQKRAQNLQDVPISVSALSAESLRANRVSAVMDLNALAPNLIVNVTASGSAIPSFVMRGLVSYGVVPGADKEVSLYIDGVYLAATRGSSFDLPDIDRIEVLRGPQGTLFGRNATGGAISIITRDPPGKFGVRQELTVGNYNEFRSKTRIDLPAWGPLSASVSYVHDERDGDIKNRGAGFVQIRNGPLTRYPRLVSPKTLGGKDSDTWFAAVKFAPSDDFNLSYKFDYNKNTYVPEGVAAAGVVAGSLAATLIATQPTPYITHFSASRPDAVNNNFTTPGVTKAYGHSITANLKIDEHFSLKNILAYRYTYNYSTYQFSGLGGLVNTLAFLGPVGQPITVLETEFETVAKQYSEEIQLNYDSKWLTVTTGLLYFHEAARSGGPIGYPSFYGLTVLAGGVIPQGTAQLPYNYQRSKAAYVQAEVHVTPQVDVVGGYRITEDNKSGVFYSGAPPISFTYKKAKPAYELGVNYKPNSDILLYGKYAAAFVSGGAVGPVAFDPETAHSWEAGVKADFLDRRLRANLAVFDVKYAHVQQAAAGFNVGHPELGTLVTDYGSSKAKGFELEVNALPMQGLTLSGGLGYTDFKFTKLTPIAIASGSTKPTLRPKWTTQLRGEYTTEPVFDDARLSFRMDANWRSKERTGNPNPPPEFRLVEFSKATWTVNGRIALQHIKTFGGTEAEVAIWGRNLTDSKSVGFEDAVASLGFVSVSYQAARTYGIDLNLEF